MKFSINPEMFAKYPRMRVGYVVAEFTNSKTHPDVEQLKSGLQQALKERYNIDPSNFSAHKAIDVWSEVYKNFGVKPKEYPSSVTSLVRRVVKGQGIWNISTVVDLYNCHSVMGLTPMGGYDLDKVSGDIQIRCGVEGETFLGLGAKETVAVKPNQVVYVDNDGVICWLWNHKDCQRTMITSETSRAVFFFDCADQDLAPRLEDVMLAFNRDLTNIGAKVIEFDIVQKTKSEMIFSGRTLPAVSVEAKDHLTSSQFEATDKQDTVANTSVTSDVRLGGENGLRVLDARLATDENFTALSSYISKLKL